MTETARRLLRRPAAASAATIGLARLGEARAACARLANESDPDALHAFRVAVRRLRTVLRAFRRELKTVPKKLERQLRELTRATSGARDAEVQLAWLAQAGKPAGPGAPWLRARLAAQRDDAYRDALEDGTREFAEVERRLRRRLNGIAVSPRPGEPFAAALSRRVLEEQATLEQEAAATRSADDDGAVHRARIAVKRLRYLLEPLSESDATARDLVGRLKQLQDVLGEAHDLQVLVDTFGEAAADAAAERARHQHKRMVKGGTAAGRRAGPRPAPAGVLALAERAARRRHEVLERDLGAWHAGPLPQLLRDVGEWAALLPPLAPPTRRASARSAPAGARRSPRE